jgi:glycosyltransferase involved in cell wall biosynthesis
MEPLVSIIIPAYNAEESIAQAIQSAVAQTWPRKEIIVVNDGSTDRTAQVVRRFAQRGVFIASTENQGQSAAINHGFQLSQGEYVQELDADDILAPDKIQRQMAALQQVNSRRVLVSSPWAPFFYRTSRARFIQNSLCQDLSPVEWLLRKMAENLHMQPATWLASREVLEAAGPWNTGLHYDQDGEYFARVLLASEGVRFVSGTGVYYRVSTSNRVSYIGNSDKKKDSLLLSIKLHIQYLRSMEESERVREACVTYLQNWYWAFYPDRPDIVAEVQTLATQFRGRLEPPSLGWKYAWLRKMVGRRAARWTQTSFADFKLSCIRQFDKTMYKLEVPRRGATLSVDEL